MKKRTAKIFGIGLSKTGTTSLNDALKILGYKSIHFPFALLKINDNKLSIESDEIEKYDALTDTPIARFYKELDTQFPDSKFILTVRDKNDWLKSCEKHFQKNTENETTNQLRLDLYNSAIFDEENFYKGYETHVTEVLDYFKNRQKDLLIMDVCAGDGWKELCTFLKKPIPNEPFPKSKQTPTILRRMVWKFSKYLPIPLKRAIKRLIYN